MAQQLGLSSHSHLSNIESGRRTASLEVVLRVAQRFRISIDYLIRDTLPPSAIESHVLPNNDLPSSQLFGTRVRSLRTKQGLLQSELAERLGGLSQSHISLLELGQKTPSLAVVLQIADFFQVTADTLLRSEVIPKAIQRLGDESD